jgi:hypothetical protein
VIPRRPKVRDSSRIVLKRELADPASVTCEIDDQAVDHKSMRASQPSQNPQQAASEVSDRTGSAQNTVLPTNY